MKTEIKKASMYDSAPLCNTVIQEFELILDNARVEDGSVVTFTVPVRELPEYRGPWLHTSLEEWGRENKISCLVFDIALDKAIEAFKEAIEEGLLFEYLQGRVKKVGK